MVTPRSAPRRSSCRHSSTCTASSWSAPTTRCQRSASSSCRASSASRTRSSSSRTRSFRSARSTRSSHSSRRRRSRSRTAATTAFVRHSSQRNEGTPLLVAVEPSKPSVLKMKPSRDRDREPIDHEPAPPDPPMYPVVEAVTPPHIVLHLLNVNEADAQLAAHPDIVARLGTALVGALPRTRMFGGRPVVQVLTRPMAGMNGPARLMLGIWLWSPVAPLVFVDDADHKRWLEIAQQIADSQERGLLSACGLGRTPTSEAVPGAGNTACLSAALPMLQRFLFEALAFANLSLPDIRIGNPRIA